MSAYAVTSKLYVLRVQLLVWVSIAAAISVHSYLLVRSCDDHFLYL